MKECDMMDILNENFKHVKICTAMCGWNDITNIESVLRLYCRDYDKRKRSMWLGLIECCNKIVELNEKAINLSSKDKSYCKKPYFLYIDKTWGTHRFESPTIGFCDDKFKVTEWF